MSVVMENTLQERGATMRTIQTILLTLSIGLLIYTLLNKRAHRRFTTRQLTDTELGQVTLYLYSLHKYEDIKSVQLPKDQPMVYQVLLKDGSVIEYFLFREGFNKYSHSVIDISSNESETLNLKTIQKNPVE